MLKEVFGPSSRQAFIFICTPFPVRQTGMVQSDTVSPDWLYCSVSRVWSTESVPFWVRFSDGFLFWVRRGLSSCNMGLWLAQQIGRSTASSFARHRPETVSRPSAHCKQVSVRHNLWIHCNQWLSVGHVCRRGTCATRLGRCLIEDLDS